MVMVATVAMIQAMAMAATARGMVRVLGMAATVDTAAMVTVTDPLAAVARSAVFRITC